MSTHNYLMLPTRQELSQIFENEETAITLLLNKNIIYALLFARRKCGDVRKKVSENSLRHFEVPFFKIQNSKLNLNKLLEFRVCLTLIDSINISPLIPAWNSSTLKLASVSIQKREHITPLNTKYLLEMAQADEMKMEKSKITFWTIS
ncbi:hypothetical protein HZS_163 [Henneguya salminicola]|nr:hypothetical protein HZS_163 [Henneguya salminicola]